MKDLTGDVTVFVLTTGEPTLIECLVALRHQNSTFRMETIKNVTPMNMALQQILDRCETKYFVQVDADMVLEPNAIARLHRSIEDQPPAVLQVIVALHDEHLDMDLLGVRIAHTEIAKRYPYRAVQGCETDQLRRAAVDGFRTIARIGHDIEPIGRHLLQPSCRAVYERYRTLFRRARKGDGIDWVYPYAAQFLRRLLKEPTEVNLYAVLGATVGLTCPLDGEEGEKDAAMVPEEFVRLYEHFGGAV